MRFITHTLMFLACMLYVAMPAQAALSITMPMNMEASDSGEAAHDGHTMSMAKSESSDPCPHRGTMTHAPFCAACLVLIPELRFAEKGRSPHAYPKPGFQRAFIGNAPAPPLPPPRV